MRKSSIALGLAAALSAAATVSSHAAPSAPPRASFHPLATAQPAGGSAILYGQSGDYDSAVSAMTSTAGNPSFAADDFSVGDVNGWTVSAFHFALSYSNSFFGPTHFTYTVHVYADAGGKPDDSGAPLCAADDLDGTLDNPPPFATLGVTLPVPCLLPQGHYWVMLQANSNTDSSIPFSPQSAWRSYAATPPPGDLPQWRNPSGSTCPSWGATTVCGWPTASALGFEVVGTVGGGGGNGLELTLTVAPDNGDPTQCGSATSLSAVVGDKLNLCYTISNHTGVQLDYHGLVDSLGGQLFSMQNEPLADGASRQFNRLVTAEHAADGTLTSTWTAQDGRLPGYDYDDSGASNFVDIRATGTPVADDLGNDSTRGIDMPFSFNFFGTTTNQLGVSNNGGLFVGMVRPLDAVNTALPNAGLLGPVLLPLWDDFDASSGGVVYQTLGDAPARRFVVQWYDRTHYDGAQNSDGATFEVVFDEASGTFSYEYDDVDYSAIGGGDDPASCNGGLCATVGLQQDATYYTQYSFDTASLAAGKSIVWRPRTIPAPFAASAQITLDIGAPVVSVAPGALVATAARGAVATTQFTLGNVGDRRLDWNVDLAGSDGADAQAHFPPMAYHAPAATPAKIAALTAAPTAMADAARVERAPGTLGGSALAAASVPAFALGGYGPTGGINPAYTAFISFDAVSPDALNLLNGMPLWPYAGGAFADNDFSHEYVIDRYGNVDSIDTTTGMRTAVGSNGGSGVWFTDLAWDAATHTMYATAWDPVATTISYLYTVDLVSGTASQVARVDGVYLAGATFDPTGHLYAIDPLGDQLIALDKRNGLWRGIGPIGLDVSSTANIDFDPRTGLIWYAGHPLPPSPAVPPAPAIYTIDSATGRAGEVGPVVESIDLVAFALAVPYAGCSQASEVPWLTITPASGTLEGGNGARVTATFDASDLAAGVYHANLCVRSNDLSNRIVGVPVTFTVSSGTQGDTLFEDGFEAR